MTEPRARGQDCPPSPPDRLPPRRGGRPSSETCSAADRPVGFARLRGTRRGFLRSAWALAAAALLALTGGLALPATATAQTTEEIWSTTLQFNPSFDAGDQVEVTTDVPGGGTSLDSTTFTHDSRDYEITRIRYLYTSSAATSSLYVIFKPDKVGYLDDLHYLNPAEVIAAAEAFQDSLRLRIGSFDWPGSIARSRVEGDGEGRLRWFTVPTGSSPLYVTGTDYTITLTTGPPSTDATLSDLTVTAGGSDLVTFVSGTTSYTASVVSAVDEVTVTPSKGDAGASIDYLDADGAVIDDADEAENGFQVPLAVGVNAITVRVTAEDGTTRDYTVTVTRATPAVVTIAADHEAFTARLDRVTFTLTRTEDPAAALDVAVALTQDRDLLGSEDLAHTVTFRAGEATAKLRIEEFLFEGTTVIGEATLTATVQDGSGYVAGSPASASTRIKVADPAVTVWIEKTAYTFDEGVGAGAIVAVILRTATGVPVPHDLISVSFSLKSTGLAEVNVDYASLSVFVWAEPSDFTPTGTEFTARKEVTLTIVDDDLDEPDETLTVRLERSPGMPGAVKLTQPDGTACPSGCEVTVTITDNDESADATLSALAVNDGGTDLTLDPAVFAPDTYAYAVSVGASVGTVTITATENEAHASVAWLDADGNAIPDGDTSADGHQVALVTGDNAITVRVTSEDRTSTHDYVVTVTRPELPAAVTVAVTSTPAAAAETYGAGETIEISVTFDEAVNATTDTDFVLSVAGRKRAPLLRGSGTETLVFGYTVQAGDSDTDGIWIGDQDRTLVGERGGDPQNGAITSVATGLGLAPTHAALGGLSAHKVNGSLVLVTVTIAADATRFTAKLDAVIFTLTRSDTTAALDVAVALTQNKALIASTELTRTVTFEAGEATAKLTLEPALFADHMVTGEAILTATVQPRLGYVPGSPASARTTVRVIDPAVTARIEETAYTFDEGAGAAATVTIVVSTTSLRVQPPNREIPLSLEIQQIAGQAEAGLDYETLATTVTAARSEFVFNGAGYTARKEVTLAILDDDDDEPDETLTLRLRKTAATQAVVALVQPDDTACPADICDVTVTITDNDESAVATLSALAVNGGGTGLTLDPVFAPETYDYAVLVETLVDTVTLSATATDTTGARVAYLDARGNAIEDGAQVALALGDNVITVRVTAANGTTTQDYTVTVKWMPPSPSIVAGGVAVTSTPPGASDTYGLGDEIRIAVTFSEAVTVTGEPHFEFGLGATTGEAALQSGSGSTSLVFAYTVQPGDDDADGIRIGDGTETLKLDTGEFIRGTGTGLDAVLDHAAPGTLSAHKVNWTLTDLPLISGVAITSTAPSDDNYVTGDVIEVTATFTEAVTVDTAGGAPRLALNIGGTARHAAYSATGSTATALAFAYPVVAADNDQAGISIDADALDLNGAAIHTQGDTGANALLLHEGLPTQSAHRVNRALVIVAGGVVVTSSPQAGTTLYGLGEEIRITVTFSEAVTVTGEPHFEFTLDATTKEAALRSGSGTESLVFGYTVQSGDRGTRGIRIGDGTQTLKLDAGEFIRGTRTGRDAALDHSEVGLQSNHRVNAMLTAPAHCTLSLDELWCATLTTGATSSAPTVFGNAGEFDVFSGGAWTGNSFNLGDDGRRRTVATIANDNASGGTLVFEAHGIANDPLDDADIRARLHLHVGMETFDLETAQYARVNTSGGNFRQQFTWTGSGLTWARGQQHLLRLTIDDDADPTDATLKELAVNDGNTDLRLTPAFAADMHTYAASVGNAVAEVTLTPTKGDAGAGVAYLDADGNRLDDADTNKGEFQVALAAGANVITVRVTSADGDTTLDYTVTVTRSALPELSVADASAVEGSAVTFTVTLSPAAAADVTATWTATLETDDTAAAADFTDLQAATATVTVKEGDTMATFMVATAQDTTDEDDETFTVTLSDPSANVELATDRTATGTIVDDDVSSDATLSDLAVSGGGADLLTFASGTTTYTAMVANDVETVTFTATKNHAGAGVAYLDAGGNTLDDADTTEDGFQVVLAVGANATTVRVTAENGTTTQDYTVTVTRAEAPPSIVTDGVSVTSTPRAAADTYGAGETIEVSVTFDEAVTATTDTDFVLSVGGAKRAPLLSGSGTETLVFGYVVQAGDRDANGIWIGPSNRTLVGNRNGDPQNGAITSVTTGLAADLTHGEVRTQSGHKVDGSLTPPAANTAPVITTTSPVETPENGTAVATLAATDADDDPITWSKTGGADTDRFALTTAGVLTFVAAPDYEDPADVASADPANAAANNEYVVFVTASDENADTDDTELELVVQVTNVDEGQSGTVSIDGTAPMVGDELTASTAGVDDPDGLPDPFAPTWRWYRTPSGGAEAEISGATSAAYTVVEADVGAALTAKASWTDGGGFTNTLASAPTAAVTAGVPAAPSNLLAAPGDTTVALSWDAPAATIARHEYRFKTDGSYPDDWTAITDSAPGGANATGITVPSLTNGLAYTFQVRAVDTDGVEGEPAESTTVTPAPAGGICARTLQVQTAILTVISGVDDCAAVTATHLSAISRLSLNSAGVGSLQSNDFAGLSSLQSLDVASNDLTELPAGVFSGLSSLQTIFARDNDLTELPADVFSGLSSLQTLRIDFNDLTELPAGVFSGLSSLTLLNVSNNDLETLPADVFSGLSSLETLDVSGNDLTELPADVFSGLSSLETFRIHFNDLTELPAGVFSGLTALETLWLNNNSLNELPAGVFSGLTSLTDLRLQGNDRTLPLIVSLEKVGAAGVRAVAPAGAPFALTLPVVVANGSLEGGATTLAIAAGEVATEAVTVIPDMGNTEEVTVDLGTPLPQLPSGHQGYAITRAATGLPVTTQAATTCTVNPGDLWCGVVTVDPVAITGVTNGHGYSRDDSAGDLSPQRFVVSPNIYTITTVATGVFERRAAIAFQLGLGTARRRPLEPGAPCPRRPVRVQRFRGCAPGGRPLLVHQSGLVLGDLRHAEAEGAGLDGRDAALARRERRRQGSDAEPDLRAGHHHLHGDGGQRRL